MTCTIMQRASGSITQEVNESPNKYQPGIWNQYIATSIVCVASFAIGASSGWSSPMMMILDSEDSPVGRMTNLEISPLETLPVIASLFGTVLFAFVITKYGRKPSGYVAACITLVGWSFLLAATSKAYLYVGRFITGLASVGLTMIGPVYLSEVSYVRVRGSIMTYTHFAMHGGTLVSFILGIVCDYRPFTAICMIGPLLFLAVFPWIPETPQFLMLKKRIFEAREALLWYRGGDEKLVDDEMKSLAMLKQLDLSCSVVLKNKGHRRAIIILVFMFSFSIMSGTGVITGYASKIFQAANSALDPNTSAAILASIKFTAAFVAIHLIERFGRRTLVLFSFTSMSICLVILTVYSIVQESGVDVANLGWLPIVCLSAYVATYTLGVGTVLEVIASEILTPEIKGIAIGLVGSIAMVVSLSSLQLYAVFIEYVGSYFNFFVEAVFAISAVFISWYLIPETQGKTLEEITDILNGKGPYLNKKTKQLRAPRITS